jgi:hypothetical protein
MDYRMFEERLLDLIFTTNTPLTSGHVAYYLRLPIQESEVHLEQMVNHGILQLDSDDAGNLQYMYPLRPPLDTLPPPPSPVELTARWASAAVQAHAAEMARRRPMQLLTPYGAPSPFLLPPQRPTAAPAGGGQGAAPHRTHPAPHPQGAATNGAGPVALGSAPTATFAQGAAPAPAMGPAARGAEATTSAAGGPPGLPGQPRRVETQGPGEAGLVADATWEAAGATSPVPGANGAAGHGGPASSVNLGAPAFAASGADGARPCPYCAEPILVAARKCKHCHERLDRPEPYTAGMPGYSPGYGPGYAPPSADERPGGPTALVPYGYNGTGYGALAQQPGYLPAPIPRYSATVAALLSLCWPGAGQIYSGRVGAGLAWMVFTILGYCAFFFPGLILHGVCVVAAANVPRE